MIHRPPGSRRSVASRRYVVVDQKRMLLSDEPLATTAPFGANATERTSSPCPSKVWSRWPVRASHNFTVLSPDPLATRAPETASRSAGQSPTRLRPAASPTRVRPSGSPFRRPSVVLQTWRKLPWCGRQKAMRVKLHRPLFGDLPCQGLSDLVRVAASAGQANVGVRVFKSHHHLPLDVVRPIIVSAWSEDDPLVAGEEEKRRQQAVAVGGPESYRTVL